MQKRPLLNVLFFCSALCCIAQTEKKETDLKAVFIYNFTKYTEWDTAYKRNDFVIGVIGQSEVTAALMQIAQTRTVNNRRMIIKQFNSPEEITNCQILFIPAGLQFSLSSILNKVGYGVLTISEQEDYARQGTAFNFVTSNDKLKFESNLKAIDAAGLKVSSQLLKLAIIIR